MGRTANAWEFRTDPSNQHLTLPRGAPQNPDPEHAAHTAPTTTAPTSSGPFCFYLQLRGSPREAVPARPQGSSSGRICKEGGEFASGKPHPHAGKNGGTRSDEGKGQRGHVAFLTPALGSVPGPRGGIAENTVSPTAGLDRPLPVPVKSAVPEEVTRPGAPNLPPVWPCSRDSRCGRESEVCKSRTSFRVRGRDPPHSFQVPVTGW